MDSFAPFENKELRNFPTFKRVLLQLREFYHLEAYNLKDIDKYLWQLGKEKFLKKY